MEEQEHLWYMNAIFYELHVKTFYDSNGDGIGDLKGLCIKLDYLQRLGVDCIWLLPFYLSPQKDDGYDISDYYTLNPDYGTMKDFEEFVTAAHQRNIRVIIDLVINHVSDENQWFQESRTNPSSPKRQWFVWSNTNTKFKEAPVIFNSTEQSNWTWDPVEKLYYWHRFYNFQADLNYDNEEVHEEIKRVVRFWLDKGVDGFRVDAVRVLYEREGTSCENLPETHSFFKTLRRMINEQYPSRILLAEANVPPMKLIQYFGKGDEFHMAFNFPLVPRIFLALAKEASGPITDIVTQLMTIPENCNWVIHLRNHDEIELIGIDEEEKDLLYSIYAKNPRMRWNRGIRRRLAPLLENIRAKIELVYGLLFSLSGNPIIYYGDEIAMGDNIYLPDRSGLRTPMQWSSDRNAGFSTAESEKLCLPVISDLAYHYKTTNVSSHESIDTSLLNFIKKIIKNRKMHAALGRGSLEFLLCPNPSILAFIRKYKEEKILNLFNLSARSQFVDLDLGKFKGMKLVDIIGQTSLPYIEDQPYSFTLCPYGFFWFQIVN
jgi:maltose alpha-D-glucosyltransferase/alpha-amylase